MAIAKKGKVDFLNGLNATSIDTTEEEKQEKTPHYEESHNVSIQQHKRKDINNWGRPRKLLIEGVKEKSITVQLPVTLLSALKKLSKKDKKSMKELIGEPLLEKYKDYLK